MQSGVLFDLDETLVDRRGTLLDYAQVLHSQFESHFKVGLQEFLSSVATLDNYGQTPRQEFFSGISALTEDFLTPTQIGVLYYTTAWLRPRLMPDAEALLKKLRVNGIPVAIVTNGQTQSQRAKIVNAGLDKLVDHIVISEEFGQRKPDAAIFNQAIEALGVKSVKNWFIGDNPGADIIGANQAGCNTIWLQRYLDWPTDQANCFNHKASNLEEVSDLLFSEFELVGKL